MYIRPKRREKTAFKSNPYQTHQPWMARVTKLNDTGWAYSLLESEIVTQLAVFYC